MAFASVIIQDLTYTETQYGLRVYISYLNGGVAGSEYVSVTRYDSGDYYINVTIASGTSTAAQIKAAVDAHIDASWLVNVTVSGTASNPQVTCKNTSLSQGTLAIKASKDFGDVLRITADTAGNAGNSIRFKLTSGGTAGSEVVTVASNDISVQIEEGVSTWLQIKTALDNDVSAAALIDVSSDGTALDQPAHIASVPSFTALTGGLDDTKAATVVQDLTFSSDDYGTSDNGRKISYTIGATAGSEVVTVAGNGDVTIQIENGVSTAQQINDALEASEDFDGVKAEGTIIIEDYSKATEETATGSITITDYAAMHLTAAEGEVVVVDYSALEGTAAEGTIEVLEYDDPDFSGATFTINGETITEGVDFDAETDNDTTATNLAAAIDALDDVSAAAVGAIVTITADATGTAGNSIDMATSMTGDEVSLSGSTLTGGANGAVLTVAGHVLTESVDWDAETDEDTTASSLKDAINALSEVSATVLNDTITITAANPGVSGNSITLETSDAVNLTVSGATLSGGINATTVTVNEVTKTESTDFNAVTDNDTTATNLAAAINAISGVDAAAVAAVITVDATDAGSAGNSIDMSKVGSGLTLSGATLSGGQDNLEIIVGTDTLVQGTDFNAVTNNDTTATNLAAAIDALSGVSATASTNEVTIVCDTIGPDGNDIALETSNEDAATVSGDTLEGGLNALEVTISGTAGTAQKTVNALATSGAS